MNTKYFNFNNLNLEDCANELKSGGIGIFPTDTVYGIGCDCLNINSINNLYNIKKRNFSKPICILVSNIHMVKKLVTTINPIEQKLMNVFWPGDLTIIFNKSKIVPDLLTSNLDTVGIRMPNNKICLELINKLNHPIATSSANISDEKPALLIDDKLINTFNNKVNFIIDNGIIENGVPSTIVRVENNEIKILREGSISLIQIMEVLKDVR